MPEPTLKFLHKFPKAEIIDIDLENDIMEFKIESNYDIKLTTDSIILPEEISLHSNVVKKFNETLFVPIEDSIYKNKEIFVKCKLACNKN